jgi:C4-dicarboxylate transporter, DctM subunit
MEYVALAILFALLIAGVPVALALIGSALVSMVVFAPDLLPGAPLQVMSTATNYILLAIPLFIMAGEIAIRGKLIEPLVDLTRALLAPVPGGAGAAIVITCMFFSGMTGSTAAEAAAVGTFGLPILKRSGYPTGFSTAVIAAASTFGILIPPSLTMVLFGSITLTPVASLFIAGLVPGLILGLALTLMVGILGWKNGYGRREPFDLKLLVTATVKSLWVLAMPAIIVIGIYTGAFTPTEVAAVVVFYGMAVALLVYRSLGWPDLMPICRTTLSTSAMLYLILIGAQLFAFVMTAESVPQRIVEVVTSADMSPMQFLIVLNILLLFLGAIFDGLSMLVITLPLIWPVAQALAIDPLHLAVLMTINIEIGVLTPPVGINLYVLSMVSGLKVQEIVRATLPFFIFLLAGLALMTYAPIFSTWLPKYLF